MIADDIFNVVVVVARKVVDKRSIGDRLFDAIDRAVVRGSYSVHTDYEQAASEFAAPYLQRIAELESNRAVDQTAIDSLRACIRDYANINSSLNARNNELHNRIAKLEAENKALRDAFGVIVNEWTGGSESELGDAIRAMGAIVDRGAS